MQKWFHERDVEPYKIFTRGSSECGQTGSGDVQEQKNWFKVPNLPENIVIKHVACGYYFCILLSGFSAVVLSESGELFGRGKVRLFQH